MPFIVALDQGTTSSRAILFDQDGAVAGVAQREFEQIFPKPGWVEHDAEAIWKTQAAVVGEVLRETGTPADQVLAAGITNQRETTVIWDRAAGQPLCNAIVWQDRRTAGFCDKLKADGHADMIRAKTGLVIDAYFSGSKVAWILENVAGIRARAEAGELAFGTIDSWLVYRLTGGTTHVTDVSNASRTMLLNLATGDWDDDLLALFKIPRSLLPAVRSSSEVYGEIATTDVPLRCPIAGIAGDQQAALFGQMCVEPGLAKNTYGTGCFMLLNTGTEPRTSANGLLTTVAWKIGDRIEYALEGSVFIAGAVVQWLRDGLGLISSSADVETLAQSVDDNGGVYFVPAFAGLGAPHWDQYARGTITGLTRGATGAHLARAALESIAYQTADVLDAMGLDAGESIRELRVDGGAASNDLLMQFQADVLEIPIVRPQVTETTALGAAYLAGLAVGHWKSREDLATHWHIDRVFEPSMSADEVATLRSRWNDALERSRGWER